MGQKGCLLAAVLVAHYEKTLKKCLVLKELFLISCQNFVFLEIYFMWKILFLSNCYTIHHLISIYVFHHPNFHFFSAVMNSKQMAERYWIQFLILTHDVLLLEMYRWTLFLKKVENFLLVSSWREKRNGNRANLRAPTWQIKAMAADGMLHSFIFSNKGEGRGVTIWVVGKIKLVFLLVLVCTYSQVFWCPYALMCSSWSMFSLWW